MGTLGGNHICFRKSFSQTFNFIRLDFFSQTFPFFRYHEWGAVCDRNLSHWIPAKGPCRWWGLSEEMIFFPKVCVTNLEFVQVTIRFLFRVTEICIFLIVSSSHNRQVGTWWREVRKRPARKYSRYGPWTWVYTHTHVDRQKRCRIKHTSINTQHGFTSHARDNK